ncbi:hypothetical protein FBU31_008161, partial [Coemansia sp. 'formosensis']
MRIIQESRALSDTGAVNRESTEGGIEPAVDINNGHIIDRSAGLNLDTLSITKEIANHGLDSPEGGCPLESLEKQPFTLSFEDDWEREQTLSHRARRYISAANDRESRLSKDLEERERQAEHAALRELDRVEERQRARDLMSSMLSKWDDGEEERLREHEYYRDRVRWWHRRKDVRARELELDAIDRQNQTLGQKEKAPGSYADIVGPELAAVEQRQPDLEDASHLSSDDHLAKQAVAASDVDALFALSIEWDSVDEGFLQTKIEPTARGLILEYIGDGDQEVADLTEFVISHIRDRKSPQSLVKELEV